MGSDENMFKGISSGRLLWRCGRRDAECVLVLRCAGVNEDTPVTLLLHLCCLHPLSPAKEECKHASDAEEIKVDFFIHINIVEKTN